jgi:hypothetical protein
VVESTTAGLDNRRASPPSGRFVIDVDHMQPVVVGKNADILAADSGRGIASWTSSYFCVFKRPE